MQPGGGTPGGGPDAGRVLAVPTRAVLTQDSKKIVRVLGAQNNMTDAEVTTGLRGSDGQIEILTGLNEGDTIVVYIKQP